jgi:hypothetical protein
VFEANGTVQNHQLILDIFFILFIFYFLFFIFSCNFNKFDDLDPQSVIVSCTIYLKRYSQIWN